MSERKSGVSFSKEEPQVFQYEETELPAEVKKKKEQSQERKDWFMDVMAVSLGIRTPERLLSQVSMEGVTQYLASGQCKRIITMAGAGISTSAGIPDYRSPGTGLVDQMKKKYPNIENPSDLFNVQFFLRDPRPFFERSRRFFEISLKPTACHYFIRLLHEKGLLLRHFTQNIDTLERLAGLPADKVVEAHGSYYTSHCMLCDAEYPFTWMEERVMKGEIPKCEKGDCTGVIKPDIVMFGESLPERFGQLAEEDTLKCDLLIIMGTALAVQPFATLTSKVKSSTPRLYINMDRGKTGKKHPMTDLMFGGSFDFDEEDNIRDVYQEGKCDDVCYAIADQLGWGDELRSLVKSEHARIDEEDKGKGKIQSQPLSSYTETHQGTTFAPEVGDNDEEKSDTTTSSDGKKKEAATTSGSAKTPWVATTKTGAGTSKDVGPKGKESKSPSTPSTLSSTKPSGSKGGAPTHRHSTPSSKTGAAAAGSGKKSSLPGGTTTTTPRSKPATGGGGKAKSPDGK